MIKGFRFLDLPYFAPCANMALDEALIENFDSSDLPIFRLYSWQRDAFTIGRFQDPKAIENFNSFGENFTRRLTGGGLLLHGFDISYSLLFPFDFFEGKSVKKSYEYICQFLINFYKTLGLSPNFAKDSMENKLSKSAFCQVGFEPYDILINEKKIGGNAQRRTKYFIYQHGSIPLHIDSREFSGTSLKDLNIDLDIQKAKELLISSFTETFNTKLLNSNLTDMELESFEALHVNKYKTKEWKYKKSQRSCSFSQRNFQGINFPEKENIQ